MSFLGGYIQVAVQWFWSKFAGGMLHKCIVRLWYFPSILRLSLLEGPSRRWYDRIDSTVVLGALPFRSQAKKLVDSENIRAVLSLNEAYELRYFTPSEEEWSKLGVQWFWLSTMDFSPPSLEDLHRGVDIIQNYKKSGSSVYVHCKAGRGRSASVTACYLMKDYGYTPVEAIQHLTAKRPQVKINARQQEMLYMFYNLLQSKKNI